MKDMKNIKCPHCKESLEGRDKICVSVIIDDHDYYGIENGEIVCCNLTPSQASYGEPTCLNCGEEIGQFLEELLDTGKIQGEITGFSY